MTTSGASRGSRDQVLARIRAAIRATGGTTGGTTGAPAGADADVDAAYAALPREYLRAHHDPGSHDIAELFAARVADYRAVVERPLPAS